MSNIQSLREDYNKGERDSFLNHFLISAITIAGSDNFKESREKMDFVFSINGIDISLLEFIDVWEKKINDVGTRKYDEGFKDGKEHSLYLITEHLSSLVNGQ